MRNRAKCKLCGTVIESFHSTDYVECKCGEICVDGGEALRCAANDFTNFMRVDDDGNEIIVQVVEGGIEKKVETHKKPTKEELLEMMSEMAKSIERLPPGAMSTPINHYDHYSLIVLLLSILRD